MGEVTFESGFRSGPRGRTIVSDRKEVSDVPCEGLLNKGMEL